MKKEFWRIGLLLIVAMMGGIFLGGNALILIFVLILMLNSLLMWQIAKLKNWC
ncbi:hypothetical protein KBC75_05775 [Candidatus Shapirobacteria bacterium]|nr:hypothetical protein [Candidatus Shapirobacteria bacterium]